MDIIFGNAAAVLQNCNIYARLPREEQSNTITAQGRLAVDEDGGIIIHNCTIKASQELIKSKRSVKTFLGRPWKNFSRTVIMQSFIDDIVESEGWLDWPGVRTDTIYYAEYANKGAGAITTGRVKWTGYRTLNRSEASEFTVRNFISGDKWIPSSGIPFSPDLI